VRPTRKIARLFRTARGSQRRTLVIGPVAIKLPRLRRLRAGLRANREERRIWREGWHRFYPELCPILGWLPFGVALVMPAVEIMSNQEFECYKANGKLPEHYPDPELYEDKPWDWGLWRGRPVVVDYAMRVHMTPEDLDLINPLVRTIDDVAGSALPPIR
jgi:hypothetical protein